MTDAPAPDEKASLLASLNAQRRHVLGILEGLADEALRRPVLPSDWTPLGLVQHLALDVERFWFLAVMDGQAPAPDDPIDRLESAWRVPANVPASEVFDLYRRQIVRADEVIAARDVDAAPSAWPVEIWPNWRYHTLRQLMLHVITETACHAGHLDAARELIDGQQWMVLE